MVWAVLTLKDTGWQVNRYCQSPAPGGYMSNEYRLVSGIAN